ncbi:MAG: acyl-CoA dehydrogenase family protein [Polyangiaceae bacterium]|nr:acyl-CoA dehydrogenase family protein [Polyangiaceae bacterium]MCB9605770.1 acyl-CoA dehydrogenase family protein [Polyangiaceae bacterium]
MDFTLSEETRAVRDAFTRWVKEELIPLETKEQLDPDQGIPTEIVKRVRKQAADLGFYSHHMPEEVGGGGFSNLQSSVLREACGRSGSFLASYAIAGPEGPSPMHLMFNAEQREHYLTPLIAGETSACFMLSEPGAGSDAQHISTRAEKRGDKWILNGTKHFITNGKHADWGVVFATNDPSKGAKGGISAFIVEPGMYQVGRAHRAMAGFEGQTEIVFEDAEVPAKNLVGQEGMAFLTAMTFLGIGRLQIAANCVGVADYLLSLGVDYAGQRQAFGQPIGARQGVQWMLADSATEIYAARNMVYHTSWLVDAGGQDPTRELSMCKLYATEMVNRVCDRVLQIHGGMGWMKDCPTERYFRSLRVLRIVEGTSEIQRMVIARTLLGKTAR